MTQVETRQKVGYEKLIVWQKADELAIAIYQATQSFPNEELYGVTSQLRRAGLSVPTNILGFCNRLEYLNPATYQELEMRRHEIGRLLWKFYKSL